MVYFRIEDKASNTGVCREYQIQYEKLPIVNKQDIEYYIADEIRKEVNGSQNRRLLSYSKSLGVCLLKYNEHVDNELHICCVDNYCYENSIHYITSKEIFKYKYYSLRDGLSNNKLFKGEGEIKLCNFVIDVANNDILNKYLMKYTNVGLKQYASPEKDSEVVMMQAKNDVVIEQYMDSIYILYALQLKYHFLRSQTVVENLIKEVRRLENFRFDGCEQERDAIIFLIQYLYCNRECEIEANQKIFNYVEKKEHLSSYYDSILQYHGVMHDDFENSYYLSDYNDNVISSIFWEYCRRYKIN